MTTEHGGRDERSGRPLVSIIIPCYNAAAFVAESIRSALDQTYPDVEVIVIDDGSTDSSLEVIKGFGDRVRWESGPNRGPCAARNRGLALARGEFIQFHDADDVLCPTKIEDSLGEFEDDVDVVFSDRRWFVEGATDKSVEHDEGGAIAFRAARRLTRLWRKEPGAEWDPERPIEYLLLVGVGMEQPVHRASALVRVGGFREDIPCAEEFDMHIRMALRGSRFKKLSKVLVLCRSHDSPHRIRNAVNTLSWRLKVLFMVHEEVEKAGAMDRGLKKAFAKSFVIMSKEAFRTGEIEQARRGFELAGRLERFHRSGAGLLYDSLSWIMGLERAEKLYVRARRLLEGKDRKRA